MALPSAEVTIKPRDLESPLTFILEDTKTIYEGAPIAQATENYATAAAKGHLTNFTRNKGLKKRGRFTVGSSEIQYNSDGSAKMDNRLGDGSYKVQGLIKGFQQHTVSVIGASGKGDVGKFFWILEDGSLTLVPPNIDTGFSGIPDGEILYWITGTTCLVLEYSAIYQSILEAAGGVIYYLEFPLIWTGVADGKLRDDFKMNHHGEILEAFTINNEALSGAGGTLDVNASIGGTNISTSGITLSTAATAAQALKTSFTLLTAGETIFHQGDSLDIDISSAGGTRTTGNCTLYLRILKKIGL